MFLSVPFLKTSIWNKSLKFFLLLKAKHNQKKKNVNLPGCEGRVQVCSIDFPVWMTIVYDLSPEWFPGDVWQCSAGISPVPEMADLAFPFSFLLFCLPSSLCWSFNAVRSWIFFRCVSCFCLLALICCHSWELLWLVFQLIKYFCLFLVSETEDAELCHPVPAACLLIGTKIKTNHLALKEVFKPPAFLH